MLFRLSYLLLLVPWMVDAQTDVGIKAGLNVADIVMTNFVNPDVEADLGLKLGIHAGGFISTAIDERFGLSGELLYSSKGVKGNRNINLHYIAVPLLLQYRLGDRVMAEAGLEPAYLFSARSRYGDERGTYSNKFDLSLDGGFRLDIARTVIAIRYCAGLFSVRDPHIAAGPSGTEKVKWQNRVLQVSLGYKVWTDR